MNVAAAKEMRLMLEEEVRSAEVERPYDEKFLECLKEGVRKADIDDRRILAVYEHAQKRNRIVRGIRDAMDKHPPNIPVLVRMRDDALKNDMDAEVECLGLNDFIAKATACDEKTKALAAEPKDLLQLSNALANCRKAKVATEEVAELEREIAKENKKQDYLKKLWQSSNEREEKRRREAEEEKEERRRQEERLAKKRKEAEELENQIREGQEMGLSDLDLTVLQNDHEALVEDIAGLEQKLRSLQQPVVAPKKPRMKGSVQLESEAIGAPPAPAALLDAPISSGAETTLAVPKRRVLPKSRRQSKVEASSVPTNASEETQLMIPPAPGDHELDSDVRAAFTWVRDRNDKDIIVVDVMDLKEPSCLANGITAGQLVCATFSKRELDNQSTWVGADDSTDTLIPNTQLFTTPDGITVGGRSGNKANRGQGMGIALAVAAAVRDPTRTPQLEHNVDFSKF